MKFAARINSFLPHFDNDLSKVFKAFKELGLKYVNLNYPEHVDGYTSDEIKSMLEENDLVLNGVNMRFRDEFVKGEFGNADPKIAKKAVDLCNEGAAFCRELGGKIVTVWLGYDGFDYTFQTNYGRVWDQIVSAFKNIATTNKDLKISIEYKPYQPLSFSIIDSMGVTGMILDEVGEDNLGVTLDYCHMQMKHENPAFPADIFGSKGKLFGIDLNDGHGLNDDGLMVGTVSPIQTLEFLYYVKKHNFDGVIYFDTFPVRENPMDETKQNIKLVETYNRILERVGMDKIQEIINENDGIAVSNLILEFFGN